MVLRKSQNMVDRWKEIGRCFLIMITLRHHFSNVFALLRDYNDCERIILVHGKCKYMIYVAPHGVNIYCL